MTSLVFDTQEFLETLLQAGIPEPHAKAMLEAQKKSLGEALDTTLATHSDLIEVKMELIQEIQKNREEIGEIKSDVRLLKWMLGALIAGVLSLIMKNFS